MLPLVAIAAQFLPSLIGLVAGDKAGKVANSVADVVRAVTGTDDPAKADAALAALPPAELLAFKTKLADIAANAESERLQAEQADSERRHQETLAVFQDIAGARARDVQLAQAGHRNYRADIMLVLAVVAVISISALLALGKVDGATAVGGFLLTVGGMFARNIGTAFDFEFGSSRSSKDKDATIADAMKR